MKCKAFKVVQRLMNGALVSSFERWRDHTQEAKRLVRAAQKVMSRWMTGALGSCFERWRDHIVEERLMKGKAFKVLQRMMNGALVYMLTHADAS